MLHLMAWALKALGLPLRLIPLKNRVAFLSRQSKVLSLDYRLAIDELKKSLPPNQVAVCVSDPESKDPVGFVLNTIKHLYYGLTSKVVIVDGYIPAVSIPKQRKGATIIQLWHALGAIKKFGYQCLDTPAGRTNKQARVGRMHKNYDWIIAGSSGAVEEFAEAFGYPQNNVLPLGLPRTDYLLSPDLAPLRSHHARAAVERLPFLDNDRKILLYAPTLRKGEGYAESWLTDYVQNLAQSVDPGAILLVAGHPLNNNASKKLLEEFPSVRFSNGIPTIDLIAFADEVITDYSAIAFEAALLGKHVSFYAPDIERYKLSPGLNLDVRHLDNEALNAYIGEKREGALERLTELILSCLKTSTARKQQN